jgi:hypothetical protein
MKKVIEISPTTPLSAARLLRRDGGGLTEARLLPNGGRGRILAGFFETAKTLSRALHALGDEVLNDASVYVTLNPVSQALLSRAPNRFKPASSGGQTKDADIIKRIWLGIDVDPVRPKGVSSTAKELARARRTRNKVVTHLSRFGWGFPVKAMSGNGAHALYPVDLPNTDESTVLVKRVLQALAAQFSTDRVTIDTAVSNAARIWKLYGTYARKGPNTPKRPHRRAYIEQAPRFLVPVSRESLTRVADATTKILDSPAQARDLVAAFKQRGLYISNRVDGGHNVVCPWADEHSGESGDTETVLYEASSKNGFKGGFKCMHDHCRDRTVKDLLKLMPVATSMLLCMADVVVEAVKWFWFPYIAFGKLTLIEGDPGIGKSWLSLALATAASLGHALPGWKKLEALVVLLLTAEDGPGDTVRPRLDQLGADSSRIYVLVGALVFQGRGLQELEDAIVRTGARVIVVDPLVAYLGGDVDLHRANETRAVMARLAEIAAKHDCAIVCIRHLTKGSQDKAIYRGLGSIDLTAACRSVLLVGRDPDNPDRGALVHIKSNLAKAGPAQSYTVDQGRFRWLGPSTLTAAQLLRPERDTKTAVENAEEFLKTTLSTGDIAVQDIKRLAREGDISDKTLRTARERLGIKPYMVRGEKGKLLQWKWPSPAPDESEATGQLAEDNDDSTA